MPLVRGPGPFLDALGDHADAAGAVRACRVSSRPLLPTRARPTGLGFFIVLAGVSLLLAGLVANAAAEPPSLGEWVLTGSPTGSGSLVALPDGTALMFEEQGYPLFGTSVQRYFPNTGGWQSAGSVAATTGRGERRGSTVVPSRSSA